MSGDDFRRYCDCGGPEDIEKPPVKRGKLPAVPIKPRDPEWFLTGSHYPTKPCLRCGSRDHGDCHAANTPGNALPLDAEPRTGPAGYERIPAPSERARGGNQ